MEKGLDLTLAPQQIQVLFQALQNGLLVVTGGPGTGKSTIVSGIIQALLALDPKARVLLAAPTGRAAKRLSELTGLEAKTIHRLLGFRWEEGRWEFTLGEEKPLEGELLVVDEFSMVDLALAYHLFQAVPAGMRVVLVGDVDQLPSVGPGHPPGYHCGRDHSHRAPDPHLPPGRGFPNCDQRPPDQSGADD